jgi:hydroxymethylpyrimidine pyrophosphatase-like HAD family hydrolase
VRKILDLENLSFDQAISFGDGYNDEEMLSATGRNLSVSNTKSLKVNYRI